RVDHNLRSSDRLFVTGYWNKRQEDRYNWAQDAANASNGGSINNFFVTKGFDYRTNTGVTAGYTSALTSRTLLAGRPGWSPFGEWRDPAQTFDPATLGFSSAALQVMQGFNYLPLFTFGSF